MTVCLSDTKQTKVETRIRPHQLESLQDMRPQQQILQIHLTRTLVMLPDLIIKGVRQGVYLLGHKLAVAWIPISILLV